MAGVVSLYQSLLGRIREQIPDFKFVHIWNNQLTQLAEGETYVFPFPCCFIELLTPNDYMPIGRGYSVGDLIVRIHIGHEEYDAGEGNYEENINVFSYRDAVINKLNNFQPIATSSLMKSAEQQDYTHTNIYHYIVDFKCAFIDSRGSIDEQVQYTTGVIEDVVVEAEYVATLLPTFDETFDITFYQNYQ